MTASGAGGRCCSVVSFFSGLNILRADGSVAEVYLTLTAATPRSGRMLLWVLARRALLDPHSQPA